MLMENCIFCSEEDEGDANTAIFYVKGAADPDLVPTPQYWQQVVDVEVSRFEKIILGK